MENTPPGALGFISGKGALSQLVLSVILATILYITLIALEAVYTSYSQLAKLKVVVQEKLISSDTRHTFNTNPLQRTNANYRDIRYSDNQSTGIEYSYSCFLHLTEENFADNLIDAHRHIFNKGSENCFPLLGPGLFINTGTNKLRLFQNNTKTWYNYIDIEDIPIGKWFHCVIVVKKNQSEVFINGNLSAVLTNEGAVIYQNYQDLIIFNNGARVDYTNTKVPSIPDRDSEKFKIVGSAKGSLSRLYYFTYALSYTEIQDLMNAGPNLQVDENQIDQPPYFIDNWWTGQKYLI